MAGQVGSASAGIPVRACGSRGLRAATPGLGTFPSTRRAQPGMLLEQSSPMSKVPREPGAGCKTPYLCPGNSLHPKRPQNVDFKNLQENPPAWVRFAPASKEPCLGFPARNTEGRGDSPAAPWEWHSGDRSCLGPREAAWGGDHRSPSSPQNS